MNIVNQTQVTLTALTLTACATTPRGGTLDTAPAVGFVRSLSINGKPVPAGVCKLLVGSAAIALNEGEAFARDLPVGHTENATIRCDRGFFESHIELSFDQPIDIAKDALNHLAEFSIKLKVENDGLMWLAGGKSSGSVGSKPMTRDLLMQAAVDRADLLKLKPHAAIEFEYVVVPKGLAR